ncbi:MAG: class I SAM-dependent methyltransferase [Bacilli bacterium]|nr:class I SAM-dependent methyltransferase [Bacilli bacterium]
MISARLEKIVALVPKGANVADVGSDHCLVPIALACKGEVGYLQAIDNKIGPFNTMEKAVVEAGMEKRIDLSLSSGLTCLDPRVDTIVIAGMGGALTLQILNEGKKKLESIEYIISDPHKDLEKSRRGIVALGYYIEEEEIVYEDDLYYFLIRYKKGAAPKYSKKDWMFGPIIRKKRPELYKKFLLEQKRRVQSLLAKPLSLDARHHYDVMLSTINEELCR